MLNGGSAPNPRDLPLRADPGHNVKTAEGLSPRRGLGPEVSAQVASQRYLSSAPVEISLAEPHWPLRASRFHQI